MRRLTFGRSLISYSQTATFWIGSDFSQSFHTSSLMSFSQRLPSSRKSLLVPRSRRSLLSRLLFSKWPGSWTRQLPLPPRDESRSTWRLARGLRESRPGARRAHTDHDERAKCPIPRCGEHSVTGHVSLRWYLYFGLQAIRQGEYHKYMDELAQSLDGFEAMWRPKK